MKVKELIEQLKGMFQEDEIVIGLYNIKGLYSFIPIDNIYQKKDNQTVIVPQKDLCIDKESAAIREKLGLKQ